MLLYLIKMCLIRGLHMVCLMPQTGSAKRLGSDAVSGSAGSSNGPKQANGPSIRDSTQVCFCIAV